MSADLGGHDENSPGQFHEERSATEKRTGSRVSKTIVNLCLDVTLLALFVVFAWISAVLRFAFPALPDASGWTLWGYDVVDWRDAQFNVLCLFGAAIVLHVMLHWSWVTGVINQRVFKRQVIPANGVDTLIGVGLLALILHLLGAGLLIARYCVVHQ